MIEYDKQIEIFESLSEIGLDLINGKKSVANAFEEILKLVLENEEISPILMDVLHVVEGEIELCADQTKAKENFQGLVELCMNTIIPEEILRGELECLDALKVDYTRQLIRLKTRLYFKQAKFNLFREESEGYSKLITELLEAENSTNEEHAKTVRNRVLMLIGQFNLDPNRVTDVILECFENCPRQKKFFIALLREIEPVREYLCALLGFKYTFCQGPNKKTPFSLYVLTASLIQQDLIDIMKILGYMVPKTAEIKEGHRARMTNAIERSSRAQTISTASMPILDTRSFDENAPLTSGSTSSSATPTTQTISFTTVAQIQEDEDAKLAELFSEEHVLSTNQKLGLACALLEQGDWRDAQMLIDRLPEYYAVQASPRLCRAFCQILETSIDPFYKQHCARRVFGDLLASSSKKEQEMEPKNGMGVVTSWGGLAKQATILWYLGPRIAYHPMLNVKLLRLLIVYFQKTAKQEIEHDPEVRQTYFDIVSECILPSLSLSDTNVALSEEIWQLLQLFPYKCRYWMYSKWDQETTRHPEMNIMRGKIYGRTKYVLKRLSKETVKLMGRQLGKLCHILPTVVLSYLLSQVQTFDNLIGPVVDGLRYLTSLELDVLTYCIISQLSDPSKQALKSTDATLSPWLQALGTLVGSLYRRYPLELNGMLDYVANQLKFCKSYDLLLLREIVQNMSWIESNTAATKEHIEALGGGEVLRQEAGGYSNARNKRAAQRLRDSLLKGDLAQELCIMIAQQKDYIVFHESSNFPMKLVGELADQCGDTLQQLSGFLVSYVKGDEYARRFARVGELLAEYGLSIESAMSLARPTFLPKIMESYDVAKKQLRATLLNGEEGGQKVKLEAAQKLTLFNGAFESKIEELSSNLKDIVESNESPLSLKLFTVFWMLGNYDIEVPTASYERAIENLKKADDRGKRGEERVRQMESKLKEEQKRQAEHVDRVKAWLTLVKDTLFQEKLNGVTESFLQTCILPRAVFSELDAVFCARFVVLLHQMRTPFFPTVIFMDRIFENVSNLLIGLSENETNSLSTFVEMLLSHAQRWHGDKVVFERECVGYPGMVTKSPMDYQMYRKLCYRWQVRFAKTFVALFGNEATDYVMVRNCLILVTKLTSCFPLIAVNVKAMEAAAIKVRDREKGTRDDLSLKAASYIGRLKKRNVKVYALVADFAPIPVKKVPASATTTTVTKKETPKKDTPKTPLENGEKKENGEPAEKKRKVPDGESATADGEKEAGEKKKRPAAKVELYVPRKKIAAAATSANNEEAEKKKDTQEDGELRTPTPPPPKKSKLGDRVKQRNGEEVKEKSMKKERDSGTLVRERSFNEKDRSKEKKKENGGESKKEHRSERKKELKDVAGPTLPESMIKPAKEEKEKRSRKSIEFESEQKTKKDREKEKNKAARIADAVPRNREKDRDLSRNSRR